jgi:tetratricopeptide (TPR) repeat protein
MKKILILIFVPILSFSQSAEDFLKKGIEKNKSNDFYGAISDLSQAIKINPNYGKAFSMRALCKSKLNDNPGVIEDMTIAIHLNSNEENSVRFMDYSTRGISRAKTNDLNGALADFNKVVELNPNDPDSYVSRGIVKKKINRNGCIDFKKACDLGNCQFYNDYCK